jgi:[acyl-carrier-protein] S-malonyltransferase
MPGQLEQHSAFQCRAAIPCVERKALLYAFPKAAQPLCAAAARAAKQTQAMAILRVQLDSDASLCLLGRPRQDSCRNSGKESGVRAMIFPGQGSQAVGMGRRLADASAAAREVFEEVNDALGQNLSRLMFEGPQEELTLTANAQPALMAVSVALVRSMEREGGKRLADGCHFVAGHSLGEYTALTAAGALRLTDAARLLRRRGEAMQAAVPVGEGAMAALLGMELEAVLEVVAAAAAVGVCAIGNDNAPGQVVVSGAAAAVQRAVELARERKVRKAVMLDVSAPFHCSLLRPAADAMQEALATVAMDEPVVPLVANVTAQPESDPEIIRRLLVEQVTATVRWRECVLTLKSLGVDTLVEMGEGKVLSGMIRRIDREMTGVAVQGPDDLETLLATW